MRPPVQTPPRATRKQDANLPTRHDLPRLDAATFVATTPPPVRWVVQELALRGGLTMLLGREGEGKSLLTHAIADAVTTGETIAGIATAAASVVIIDAENGQSEIHRRLRAFRPPNDPSHSDAKGELRIYDASEGSLDLDHGGVATIKAIIEQDRPDLLILDSFASLRTGSEYHHRARDCLAQLRRLARQYDCAVLLLHHLTKSGTYRGSTMIAAEVDMMFSFGTAPEDPDQSRRYLVSTKARNCPRPDDRWLRFEQADGSLLLEQARPFILMRQGSIRPVRSQLIVQIFLLLTLSDRPLTRSEIARRLQRQPHDRSVGRVLAELQYEGLISRLPDLTYAAIPGTEPT